MWLFNGKRDKEERLVNRFHFCPHQVSCLSWALAERGFGLLLERQRRRRWFLPQGTHYNVRGPMHVHSCANILSRRLTVDWGRQQGGPWFRWRGVKESSWRGRGLEPQLGAGLQISQIHKVREGHSVQREQYAWKCGYETAWPSASSDGLRAHGNTILGEGKARC